MPVQLTTTSASTSPLGVRTPVTRRRPPRAGDVRTPSTGTPSTIVAPCRRAPLASAIVTSTGLARPSSAT
jgi:hypothetical protein